MSSNSVFGDLDFWLMAALSVVLPFGIYGYLLSRRAVSTFTIVVLGLALVAIAGVDVYFLQLMAARAQTTLSHTDDMVFSSEISAALYLFPALFGGLGLNVLSHVLTRHLDEAQRRFAAERDEDA